MIPVHIRQLLNERGYSTRSKKKESIHKTLEALRISSQSDLGSFYLEYDPSIMESATSFEQLEDVTIPFAEGQEERDYSPSETQVFMVTSFIQEVWGLADNYVCLSSTEGEGAYLYDLESGEVHDFSLSQRSDFCEGKLAARWSSFFEFIEWYIS